jgi:filamentous hemagglutinin family protein
MQSSTIKFWLSSGIILFYLLAPKQITAQIVPDQTLPTNSSVPLNCSNCDITGGTTRGINLFHSFREFSIPEGVIANFISNPAIQNIISRVTGGSRSDIYGTIKVTGSDANLFLLNPNGIIFGPNASLDIRGSFIASTASSLKFSDGTEFRTDGTQTTPLLTMSVPMGLQIPSGLQFGANPERILNQALPLDKDNGVGRLQVPSGKTLALVGGNVALEGGYLTTPGGRIELGSVAGNNLVSLKQTNQGGWELGYQDIQNFQDISLSEGAYAGSSNSKGADIQIQGRYVTITGSLVGSASETDGQSGMIKVNASDTLELVGKTDQYTALFNQVSDNDNVKGGAIEIQTRRLIVQGGALVTTNTFGKAQGADLKVNALESVELTGGDSDSTGLFAEVGNASQKGGSGNGGTLTIETGRLIVQNGANVSTITYGAGRAGDLIVNATELVKLEGRAPINNLGLGASLLSAQVGTIDGLVTTGNAGNLTINTPKLEVLGGAQISATARSQGSGGTLTINSKDSILLSGSSQQAQPTPNDLNRSGVFVSATTGSTKNAGVLNINTGVLTVENGARISAQTRGLGNGGTANLNVGKLVIQNGGEVRAGSFAEGSGGTLNVNASESVQVIGKGTVGTTDLTPVPSKLSAEATSSGKAGDLNITTPRLDVRDDGQVSVSGTGSGQAGTLTITAKNIRLNNNGKITAETNAGEGANITLKNVDQLLMENNSKISAAASGVAKGGNINIDAANGFVVGVPGQNNDIVANAVRGNGGRIDITTSGIYGFTVGTSTENTNDINASSQFGLPGTVTINRGDVDPTQSLVELPANVVDPSRQIASGCGAANVAGINQFTVTGRGGLPPSPNQPLSSDVIWSDTRIPKITAQGGDKAKSQTVTTTPSSKSRAIVINPATGWVFNGKGEVRLISSVSSNNSNSALQNSASCAAR